MRYFRGIRLRVEGWFAEAFNVNWLLRLRQRAASHVGVAAELGHESVDRLEFRRVAKPLDELDADTESPYQSPVASNRWTSSMRSNSPKVGRATEVHHAAE